MKKRMIRLLSLALCLLSFVSLLPMTALAASTPGKPTDLKWHVARYTYNGEAMSYEGFGYVSAKAATPYLDGTNYFIFRAYKDDKLVDENRHAYSKAELEENNGYVSSLFADAFENGTGTYHFTVTASTDYYGTTGSTATSKDYKYTQPSVSVAAPTNVRIEWPYVSWDGSGADDERFYCALYYSNTPDELGNVFYFYSGYGAGTYEFPAWNGNGYYTAMVRGTSTDITVKNHSEWVTGETVYIKMDGPDVKISTVTSSGKPKLTWSYADDHIGASVVEYEVYRATSKSGTYKKLTATDKSSYTDASATAGKKYYYKVKGITSSAGETSYSSIVSSYCDLARPTAKTSITSKGYVKVSWEKIDGAKEYKVYRATSENGEYKLMKTTTSTSYTNTSGTVGKTYYYKVKAIHETESANSAMSKAVSGTRKLITPSITLENVASSGKIKVSWDAVPGAASYNVYRATSKTGTYKLVKNTTNTSYTNTSAVAGKTYYYKVEAVGENASVVSAKSGYKYRTCDLARPDVTVTLKNNGDPKLTWKAIAGAEKYEIYRSTSKSGTYEKIKTTTSTSFTNTSAAAGKTYYYKVKAIHSKSAANSAYSSIDQVSISKNKGIQVWIPTNGGTKYHSRSSCSSMKSPKKVYLDQALDAGYSACKKCY